LAGPATGALGLRGAAANDLLALPMLSVAPLTISVCLPPREIGYN
jgi:hypothetical protein